VQATVDKKKDIVIDDAHKTSEFMRDKHVAYLLKWARDTHEYEYQMTEHLRMSGTPCLPCMLRFRSLELQHLSQNNSAAGDDFSHACALMPQTIH
jgi:hypothetical protein